MQQLVAVEVSWADSSRSELVWWTISPLANTILPMSGLLGNGYVALYQSESLHSETVFIAHGCAKCCSAYTQVRAC